jgi:hypothetical protein
MDTVQQRILNFDDLIAFLKTFHALRFGMPEKFKLDDLRIPSDLPVPLRRLYLEFGALIERSSGPFSTQDRLVPPGGLRRHIDAIEFAWENQGNWSARTRLNASDPPVLVDIEVSGQFEPVCESLEHFLTTLCLQEAIMSSDQLICLDTDDVLETIFQGTLEPVWLHAQYVQPEPSHDFYTLENGTILVMWFHEMGTCWVGSSVGTVEHVLQDETHYQVISPW